MSAYHCILFSILSHSSLNIKAKSRTSLDCSNIYRKKEQNEVTRPKYARE